MSDMFDALIGDQQVDPATLAQALRQKQQMGTVAALTGISGLQKLGPQMISEAASGAQDYATLRDRTANQGLQRALQWQGQQNENARAAAALEEKATQAQTNNDLRKGIADQADATRRAAIDAHNQAVKDKEDAVQKQKQDAAEGISASFQDMIDKAKALRANPALSRITGVEGHIYNYPGSAASDAEAQLNSLKNEAGLSALQALRAGGTTLGRVTNLEFSSLQSSIAPLIKNQSKEGLQAALDHLIAYGTGARGRIRKAAGLSEEDGPNAPAAPPPSALPGATGAMQPGGNPLETAANYSGPAARYPANNPVDNAPAVEPGTAAAVQLTPAEQVELAALKRRFGR